MRTIEFDVSLRSRHVSTSRVPRSQQTAAHPGLLLPVGASPVILVILMIMGLLIVIVCARRPVPSRDGIAGDRLQNQGFGHAGDDAISTVPLQDSWTELDEYQLRRLLDS